MKRAIPVPIACLVLGCTQGRVTTVPAAVRTIVTDSVNLTESSTFPEIPDSAKGPHGELLAAANAPPCTLAILADTLTWLLARTPFASRYLQAITFWVPPDYKPYQFNDTSAASEDTTEDWGHILGSWWGPFRSTTMPPEDLAIWIGPREGYPESGIWGDPVQQVSYSECRLSTSVGTIPIALFQVHSPNPLLSGYHVITYWQLKPGVFVRAAGSGPDSISQARLLAALETIRVIR